MGWWGFEYSKYLYPSSPPPSYKNLVCRILMDGFGSLLHFRAIIFSLNIPTFEFGSSLDALEMSKKIDF